MNGIAGPAGAVTVTAANGNHDGSPVNARVFTARHLTPGAGLPFAG